jgi:hypothetical protein
MGEYWTKSSETNKFTLFVSLVINLLSRSMRFNIAVGSFGYRQRATCAKLRLAKLKIATRFISIPPRQIYFLLFFFLISRRIEICHQLCTILFCGKMRQTALVAIFIQRCLHNDIGSLSAIIVYKNWE